MKTWIEVEKDTRGSEFKKGYGWKKTWNIIEIGGFSLRYREDGLVASSERLPPRLTPVDSRFVELIFLRPNHYFPPKFKCDHKTHQ